MENKNKMVGIRVTEDEQKYLKECARSAKMRLASYIRLLLFSDSMFEESLVGRVNRLEDKVYGK